MSIDQDGIEFDPIVWIACGEVVGNWVEMSIRNNSGVHHCLVMVTDSGGIRDSAAVVTTESLLAAKEECIGQAMRFLGFEEEVRDE